MCGISGIFSNQDIGDDLLWKIASSMNHRGPDFQAFKRFGHFYLIHARLSILDLNPRSNQPMVDRENTVAVCFNGEIYNFNELRIELESLGHHFQTTSDTEVVLLGFKQWKDALFPKLNGIFSIALLDLVKDELFLVRDPSGTKPLFYSYKSGCFAFSSELKAQLMLPWISKEVDNHSLFYFLKFSHVPHPNTMLKEIKQLEPSAYLKFSKNSFSIQSYAPKTQSLFTSKPFTETVVDLDNLFENIVKRQMVADVPVGCFLSGGIDSSLICYYHTKLSTHKVKTFTIGYSEKEFDESVYAKEISRFFGTEHFELILKPADLINEVSNLPKFFDHPFADPTMLPSLLLAKHAAKEVKVVFSGDGGDELFFGYHYQSILLHTLSLINIPNPIRSSLLDFINLLLSRFSKNNLSIQRIRKFLDIFTAKDQAEFMQYFIGTIGPLKISRLNSLLKQPSNQTTLPIIQAISHAKTTNEEKIFQLFKSTFLVNCALQKNDRSTMAYGLEARVPFLDNEMIAFAKSLPFDYVYRKGSNKHILRTLLGNKIPSSLSQRKKQGFSVPLREWMRNDLKELVQDNLGEGLRTDSYLNYAEVQKLINEHMDNRANHSHLIWSLLMYKMWSREYRL